MGNVAGVDLPLVSGPVAAWLAARAGGACGTADSVAACSRASGTDALAGPDGGRTPWHVLVESASAGLVHLVLPDHGDPGGLGDLWDGQPGERILITGASPLASAVTVVRPDPVWSIRVHAEADPALLAGLRGAAASDAARLLAAAIREATASLSALGLDRPDPDVRARLARLEEQLQSQPLPRALRHPERIDRASRMLLIARRALAVPGAEVTSSEADARAEPLRELARAARRALGAAYVDVGTVRA